MTCVPATTESPRCAPSTSASGRGNGWPSWGPTAGKTTLLKTISGTVDTDSGSVRFDGRDLLAQAPHKRVEAGVVHVPQGRMIFASMTVADNLRLGCHRTVARDRHDERRELVLEIFPALADMLGRDGGALSGGQQQMLAAARGIVACPRGC